MMRPLKTLYSSVLLLLAGGLGYLSAEETPTPTGDIVGRVVNASYDDRPLARWEVILHAYSETGEESLLEVRTDDEGLFSFKELPVGPDKVYLLSVEYVEVEYFSDPVLLTAEAPEQPVILRVYESSADASRLEVVSHHLIINAGEKGLRVEEFIMVRNADSFTYTGEGGPTLRFSLPEGAANLEIGRGLSEENASVRKNTVSFFVPVTPETLQISYLYDLPVRTSSYLLRRIMDYPTARFDVFLSLLGTTMISDQLASQEPFQVEDREYLRLSGGDLTAGTDIELYLEDLPRRWMKALQMSLFIAAAFVFAGLLLYASLRRRRRPAAGRNAGLLKERNVLIAEIADLDDDLNTGNSPNEECLLMRTEKKRRLVEITRLLRGIEGASDG